MTRQEKEDFKMYVINLYDTLINIQENRNISYGELAHVESLKIKELRDLENEIVEELTRITKITEDFRYLLEEDQEQ